MRQTIIALVVIGIFAWGFALFLSYLAGISKIASSQQKSSLSGVSALEDQHHIADETTEMNRRAMDDLRFQRERFKNTQPIGTPFKQF